MSNQLPLRGQIEVFENMHEGGSGLFMSFLQFSIRKDPELAQIVKTIPKNATNTSHEILNELIAVMSSIVTDAIVNEIGDPFCGEGRRNQGSHCSGKHLHCSSLPQ